MAGLRSVLRDALLSIVERADEHGSRMIVRRLPENERGQAAQVAMHIGGDAYGFRPKDVTWAIDLPTSEAASEIISRRLPIQDALRRLIRERRLNPSLQGRLDDPEADALSEELRLIDQELSNQSYADYKAAGPRVAPAAFKAARQALMDDIASRSPFEPWTPNAGYSFTGATPKHDAIYARMLAQTRHPDYITQTDGHRTVLRRKFPFRHEVAAGGALGALAYASDTE